MRANQIRTPESMEIDRAPGASVGDRVSSDAAVAVAKSLVHTHLVVPSLTALNALLRGEWGRLGTLTEADEKEAMRAFKVADLLGPEVLVLPRVEGLEGRKQAHERPEYAYTHQSRRCRTGEGDGALGGSQNVEGSR